MIDTHAHIYGEEFGEDFQDVLERAREAGVEGIMLPATDASSCRRVLELCREYKDYLYPMLGLHPEDVKADWESELDEIEGLMRGAMDDGDRVVGVGEVGLDYYWSREMEKEQIEALDRQVGWSVDMGLPLMIHCRKAQAEMVRLLKGYKGRLCGGVFHCFTGNEKEAEELLRFDGFVLGIGGVLTFKNSRLGAVLAGAVPLDRIVLETDAPYMAPVPMRGRRNESAYVALVLERLAEVYGVTREEVERVTNETCQRLFGVG